MNSPAGESIKESSSGKRRLGIGYAGEDADAREMKKVTYLANTMIVGEERAA